MKRINFLFNKIKNNFFNIKYFPSLIENLLIFLRGGKKKKKNKKKKKKKIIKLLKNVIRIKISTSKI
jgi:hypothetical protein